MASIEFRDAVPRDLQLLLHWQSRPHVIEAGVGEDWGWRRELSRRPPWRRQLIAEFDGRPVGFVQIIDPALEDSHYWGEIEPNLRAIDIWIGEPSDLGRGLGSAMMKQALVLCFADESVKAVILDPLASNHWAHRFYRRFGFRLVETRTFDDDDCHVMRLERQAWEDFATSSGVPPGQSGPG